MKGVILLSHGRMAEGMMDSARLFFGENIPQLDCLCLLEGGSPDEFHAKLVEKVKALDTGDGVIALADLHGGTPANQAATLLGEGFDLIARMNFGILMQILSEREDADFDLQAVLADSGSAVDVKAALLDTASDDDFLS